MHVGAEVQESLAAMLDGPFPRDRHDWHGGSYILHPPAAPSPRPRPRPAGR